MHITLEPNIVMKANASQRLHAFSWEVSNNQVLTFLACVVVFACTVAMAQKRSSSPPKIASAWDPWAQLGKRGSKPAELFLGFGCRVWFSGPDKHICTWAARELKASEHHATTGYA